VGKFFNVPDNYDQWKKHQAEEDEWLESMPKCAECGEHIQDKIVIRVNGSPVCRHCADCVHGIELENNY
jgi:formylmethanofuran dehydrogenase subunit E